MSRINQTLISEAKTLLIDISKSTDSIEKELPRTSMRIFCALMVPALFAFDAGIDKYKLEKINAKLIDLDNVKLDVDSEDYKEAKVARNFQKEVYENVTNYTLTARKIKDIISVGTLLFFAGMTGVVAASRDPNVQDPNLELATMALIYSGALIAIPSAVYGVYHWMSEGNKLEGAKQILAKQATSALVQR